MRYQCQQHNNIPESLKIHCLAQGHFSMVSVCWQECLKLDLAFERALFLPSGPHCGRGWLPPRLIIPRSLCSAMLCKRMGPMSTLCSEKQEEMDCKHEEHAYTNITQSKGKGVTIDFNVITCMCNMFWKCYKYLSVLQCLSTLHWKKINLILELHIVTISWTEPLSLSISSKFLISAHLNKISSFFEHLEYWLWVMKQCHNIVMKWAPGTQHFSYYNSLNSSAFILFKENYWDQQGTADRAFALW